MSKPRPTFISHQPRVQHFGFMGAMKMCICSCGWVSYMRFRTRTVSRDWRQHVLESEHKVVRA